MKHKHYDTIMAWAGGAKIQVKPVGSNVFRDIDTAPSWSPHCEYRIKPKPPAVRFMRVSLGQTYFQHEVEADIDNIKLTFDADSGILLSVEKI